VVPEVRPDPLLRLNRANQEILLDLCFQEFQQFQEFLPVPVRQHFLQFPESREHQDFHWFREFQMDQFALVDPVYLAIQEFREFLKNQLLHWDPVLRKDPLDLMDLPVLERRALQFLRLVHWDQLLPVIRGYRRLPEVLRYQLNQWDPQDQ